METIRYVKEADRYFWSKLDKHLTENEFQKKVKYNMGYIIELDNTPLGLLRYNLFWDNIPFCTMLFIDFNFQQKGYGKKLMGFWEQDMKSSGYGMVMTSTQVDEPAQHFYRKIGYHDSGSLIITIPQYKQPMEMFFTKAI